MLLRPHNDLVEVMVKCLYRDLEDDDLKKKVEQFSDCIFCVMSPVAGVLLLLVGFGEYASMFGIASVDYFHSRYIKRKNF